MPAICPPRSTPPVTHNASAGLIISEATHICVEGQGHIATPYIHSAKQNASWKLVTAAVHAQGGRLVLQLWHVGRISHTSLQPDGKASVAPSAIRAEAKTFVAGGFVDVSMPRALELAEIPALINTCHQANANAIEAGFDGAQVHAANGYLIDQFLRRTRQKPRRSGYILAAGYNHRAWVRVSSSGTPELSFHSAAHCLQRIRKLGTSGFVASRSKRS